MNASWQWQRLLDAPHRLGFWCAALVLALSALWWMALLGLRATDVAVPWAMNPSLSHALLFTWGFMPLFIVGFLFTAGPRWLQVPELPARTLQTPVTLFVASLALAVTGFHTSTSLAGWGLLGVLAAWGRICLLYAGLWRASKAEDKVHARVILVACLCGAAGLLLSAAGAGFGNDTMVRAGIHVGLWCFIATVFAAVSHRMIPFFTASAIPFLDAWRPQWLLWCMVGALWWVGLGNLVDLYGESLPAGWRGVQAVVELTTGTVMLWLAVRWGLVQSLKIRLLAMLHGGFLWLGLALVMHAAHHIGMALSPGPSPWGLAPLHALTMGYLGATLFAMATRVAAGHSGRPLAADNLAWGLYWAVQAAIVLRLVAALDFATGQQWPLLAAIALWAAACCAWALRYGRWFGRPRLDGRPG